jgi:hypothetical protein
LTSHETTWQSDRRSGEESDRGDDGEDHFEFDDSTRLVFECKVLVCL